MSKRTYAKDRSEVVQFRVSQSEKTAIRAAATAAQMTSSDYCRSMVLGNTSTPDALAYVTANAIALERALSDTRADLEARLSPLEAVLKEAKGHLEGDE